MCTSNPCENRGICNITNDGYECICEPPYTGKICNETVCTSNPCENGGICNITNDGYECICRPPYTGEICNENPCSMNPCQNGGSCKITDAGYKCMCKSPYSGQNCDKNTNSLCNPNPCGEGSCIERNDEQFICICPADGPFYMGNCVPAGCVSNPCQNNGTCKGTIEDQYECECLKGFQGINCEIKAQDPCLDPCKIGNCTNGSICECNATHKGSYCKASTKDKDWDVIIYLSCGVGLLLLIILGITLAFYRRRKRRSEMNYINYVEASSTGSGSSAQI